MKTWEVFCVFVAIRLASVFLVQTWYVPDEYWQSLEVAHKFAYGYGYLTWEWAQGIRSYVHPLIIAFVYKILHILNVDYTEMLIYIPRILQALLSAYADLRFYHWSGTKKWAIFTIGSSWFWFYTGSRTLLNTLETALTTIALSYFPWSDRKTADNSKFIWILGILCAIRPTAVIPWLPLCFYHIWVTNESIIRIFVTKYLPIGLVILTVSVLTDSLAHGSLLISSYQFLKANVLQDVGSWYGSQPWHWYLSNGLPAILGIHMLSFSLATFHILKYRKVYPNELALLGTIVFTVATYSFLPHKEFRFLLPILPMALHISAVYLSRWSCKADMLLIWIVTAIIAVGNLIPAWYLGMVHQRGALDVMVPLREIANANPHNTSLLFLTPCHSTPLYSHLHMNVSTRFLTCTPNLHNILDYVDEADSFYGNPRGWLRNNYPPSKPLPSHIITYDSLIPHLSDIFSRYKPIKRVFHTSISSGRVGKYFIIHERINVPSDSAR